MKYDSNLIEFFLLCMFFFLTNYKQINVKTELENMIRAINEFLFFYLMTRQHELAKRSYFYEKKKKSMV
jgi:hypothetical protein